MSSPPPHRPLEIGSKLNVGRVTNPRKIQRGARRFYWGSVKSFNLHGRCLVFYLYINFSTTQSHQHLTVTSESRFKSKLQSCRSPRASPRAFKLHCFWKWALTLSYWSRCCEISLELISFDPALCPGLTGLHTGSRFNRVAGPLVLLLPDPQEINEYVALRWPLCISTHQKHHRQVARVQDDRETIPPFISPASATHIPSTWTGPGNPREKRLESLCTKVTRNHKVQLSLGSREGSEENRLYSSSNLFILTV